MATTTANDARTALTVVEPVADDGTCRLHARTSGRSYRVVDYAGERLREKLAMRAVGETVRVDLVPADPDGLDWIATRLRPGAAATPGLETLPVANGTTPSNAEVAPSNRKATSLNEAAAPSNRGLISSNEGGHR